MAAGDDAFTDGKQIAYIGMIGFEPGSTTWTELADVTPGFWLSAGYFAGANRFSTEEFAQFNAGLRDQLNRQLKHQNDLAQQASDIFNGPSEEPEKP